MKSLTLLLTVALLSGCAAAPTKRVEVPTLKYARNAVSDVKDFNAKARKSNNEIDELVKQLLKNSSE